MIDGRPTVLDIGCGRRKAIKEAIGIDRIITPHTDIVADLDYYPWPLRNGIFDLVICNHIIEHVVDAVKLMDEVHRIAKAGAIVKGATPHFSSPCSYDDPTHKHHFSARSFDFFCIKNSEKYPFLTRFLNRIFACERGAIPYYTEKKFKKVKVWLHFRKFYRMLGVKYFANKYIDITILFLWYFKSP